jgi:protoheme IX farnesyltransferase
MMSGDADVPVVSDYPALPLRSATVWAWDVYALTKLRLSLMVLLATFAGYFMGCSGAIAWGVLFDTLLGTALVAAGSSALNQVIERLSDAKMRRTHNRPVPAGRMSPGAVLLAGAALSISGMLYLAAFVNLNAAVWASVTLGLYVFIYTPLKRVTTLNTLVGALPGALPPLIGWVAARGELSLQAWAVFAVIFVWQLPHFLAIAWIYRADYARAKFVMLPSVDEHGLGTARQVSIHSLMLLPVSMAPFVLHMSGLLYVAGALLLGLAFLAYGLNFAIKRTDDAARQLFLSSVFYLPLLLALMMVDKR